MKEPERPGNVIPETLIIPQRKMNIKLSFSFAGFKKLIAIPIPNPIIAAVKVFFFQ